MGFVPFEISGGVLLLIAIILLILAHRKVTTTEYFITNLRTYVRYSSIVTELENESITYVGVLQSALGRLMNYGNVIISTPGRAGAVTMVGSPTLCASGRCCWTRWTGARR
ncbi:MAG: PH domain-containing protein [Acidilobus sp.]